MDRKNEEDREAERRKREILKKRRIKDAKKKRQKGIPKKWERQKRKDKVLITTRTK